MSNCKFCQIIGGHEPSHTVFEDDVSVAFLDHRPVFPGHCLLVPRDHYVTLADLPAAILPALFGNAQILSRAVEAALDAQGSFVAMNNKISQSVPHFHIHIVPRRQGDGLRGFFWPRHKYGSAEAMVDVQQKLRLTISRLR